MRKFNVIAAIFGLGLGFAAAAPAAHASGFNLIPEQEGEVKLENLDALSDNVIDLGFKVTSLEFDDPNTGSLDYGLSRLFIDKKGTTNDYGDDGQGGALISFGENDQGTNEGGGYWLRAAAIQTDGTASEGGQLEVGRFLLEFEQELEEITIDLFDVERINSTGILEVNGVDIQDIFAEKLDDGETQTLTLNNVSSLVLQLGQHNNELNDDGVASGDGVTLTGLRSSTDFVKTVPEPTTTISLGALAVAGMFGVKKRKKLKK